jgi:putative AlgH/UPF0301 family transcriptional regulator
MSITLKIPMPFAHGVLLTKNFGEDEQDPCCAILLYKGEADRTFGFVLNRCVAHLNLSQSLIHESSSGKILSLERSVVPLKNHEADFSRIPIFWGGLEDSDKTWMIHSKDYEVSQTIPLTDCCNMTPCQWVFDDLLLGKGPQHFRVIAGRMSWSKESLEEDLKETSWIIIPGSFDLIFNTSNNPLSDLLTQENKLQDPLFWSSSLGSA